MMKIGKLLSWAFRGGIGLLILYFIYTSLGEQVALREYGTFFSQARHPSDTTLLDSLSLSFSIYPATYMDERIDLASVYLVGELRRYTSSWEDVELFHQQKPRLEDGNRIVVLPLALDQAEQSTWLEIMDGVSFDPSDAA